MTNLDKVGDEVMLILPPAILDQAHLRAGARIGIAINSGRLVIEPQTQSHYRRPHYRLDDLLDQCDPMAERNFCDGTG
uniref:Antitoxin ChpS n=1 Tax=Candidatus Kentrum sp. MB TaxID=2138164 RepID=A0A450X769_9GAMM|nr:MAG: antitoxin ChpS [Candidatus Kentron sp. MB]VFK29893.1 MAG: antitoxin ChpS [Candidatus Kentron sp. MB]VFK74985.1 MAG: antitoxin ChpS [Candidatus Kentron sp. MB]